MTRDNRQGCMFVVIGLSSVFVILLLLALVASFLPKEPRLKYSNSHIDSALTNDYIRMKKDLNYIAGIMDSTHSTLLLSYGIVATPQYRHRLWPMSCNGCYPFVSQLMRKKWHSVRDIPAQSIDYRDGVLWMECDFRYNKWNFRSFFVYSKKPDSSLEAFFDNRYRIYDTITDDINIGWMKKIDDGWYILCPDYSLHLLEDKFISIDYGDNSPR